MKRLMRRLALSMLVLAGAAPVVVNAQQAADVLYHGGRILTMVGDEPAYVEALAVKDGRIAFAGAKDQALAMRGEATRVVDLEGKALLPGFIDGHGHYINSLLVANQAKLYPPPSGPGKDVSSC